MLNRVVVRGVSYHPEATLLVNFYINEERKAVPVRLIPVDDNPYDHNAVMIEAQLGKLWGHIGFLASELCQQFREMTDSRAVTGDVIEADVAENGKYAGIVVACDLPRLLNRQCAVGNQPKPVDIL